MLQVNFMSISCEIALRWMPQNNDNKLAYKNTSETGPWSVKIRHFNSANLLKEKHLISVVNLFSVSLIDYLNTQ